MFNYVEPFHKIAFNSNSIIAEWWNFCLIKFHYYITLPKNIKYFFTFLTFRINAALKLSHTVYLHLVAREVFITRWKGFPFRYNLVYRCVAHTCVDIGHNMLIWTATAARGDLILNILLLLYNLKQKLPKWRDLWNY